MAAASVPSEADAPPQPVGPSMAAASLPPTAHSASSTPGERAPASVRAEDAPLAGLHAPLARAAAAIRPASDSIADSGRGASRTARPLPPAEAAGCGATHDGTDAHPAADPATEPEAEPEAEPSGPEAALPARAGLAEAAAWRRGLERTRGPAAPLVTESAGLKSRPGAGQRLRRRPADGAVRLERRWARARAPVAGGSGRVAEPKKVRPITSGSASNLALASAWSARLAAAAAEAVASSLMTA